MDAEDLELFRTSLVASVDSAPAAGPGGRAAALCEVGWPELVAEDLRGAVDMVFTEQGRRLWTTPCLDYLGLVAAGLDVDLGATLVHPAPGTELPATLDGDVVSVDGVVRTHVDDTLHALLPDGGVVRIDVDDMQWTALDAIDPSISWRVNGRTTTDRLGISPGGPDAVLATMRRSICHELLGTGAAVLELATEQVTERTQFGRPIASFQSVRHRLADAFVELESARSVLDAAWGDGSPIASTAAKATAGRAARAAALAAQQVCGAVGFTWEHQVHHHLRRVLLLDGLYGSSEYLVVDLGRRLIDAGKAPRIDA